MTKLDATPSAPPPLSIEYLCRFCDPAQFSFNTTAELEDQVEVAGQDRAVSAIQFALGVKQEGYNVFVLGPPSTGKHAVTRKLLNSHAKQGETPSDWCYVYNFEQRHKPIALQLPAGDGTRLRDAIEKLIKNLKIAIAAIFENDEYRKQRKIIADDVKKRQEEAFKKIQLEASELNVAMMQTESGIAFGPMCDGEMMLPEELNSMSNKDREKLQKNVDELQKRFRDIMMMVPKWAREAQEKLLALDQGITTVAAKAMIEDTRAQFANFPRVQDYLEALEKDVIDNVDIFRTPEEGTPATPSKVPGQNPGQTPNREPANENLPFRRYRVNLLVDCSRLEGSPVVYADNPTYQELIGTIEHSAEFGTLTSDFTRIKSGALHRANGGYLILDARKILMEPFAWEGLKRALRSHEIRIENPSQSAGVVSTQTLSPEPIPLNIKVVLIGERHLYYHLDQHDSDFAEIFKVTSDFEDTIERTEETNLMYARLLGSLTKRDGMRPLSNDAVAKLCDYSARLASDAERLSTQMRRVNDLVREADYFSGKDGRGTIEAKDVLQAIEAARNRVSRIREALQEEIIRETILIDTEGERVGQINGLAVMQTGRYAFGKPSRITVCLRMGTGKVIDIEREVDLGGPLHSKGVLILSSYLASRYATDSPLSLAASIVFEQSYGGVDGDSASSTELYALLSALAEVPIKQSLAVTGAVNQHGEIQAIGGANEKIEGFFDICKTRGLTGNQGALIPQSNVQNLMLRHDVIEAVRCGLFSVYAISNIDEGIEILTGIPAGTRGQTGVFPVDSINGKVEARLVELAEKRRAFGRKTR